MSSRSQDNIHDLGDISKQRAGKACNRCRAKKARCSGGYPCSKCKSSDALCIFGYPKKSKRRTFSEHYVRTLETQQIKLVAGLQTMYFMLLAANSWPGSRLPENKGTPSIHDILDRLGLLESQSDRGSEMGMEISMDRDVSDNTDEASTVGSSESPQQSPELMSQSCSGHSHASPNCASFQSQLLTSWQPQPVQLQSHSLSSIPQPLSTSFASEPTLEMNATLPNALPSTEGLQGTTWDAVDYFAPWWPETPQNPQGFSLASVGSVPEIPDINMPVDTNVSETPTTCDSSSYLVDPGVYACDFDVD